MRTSIAILSALAATAAANTAYTTVDVTITSCGPEVTNCPAKNPPAAGPSTLYTTLQVTVTSCGPDVTSCPGKPTPPASYPPSTNTNPVAGSPPSGPNTSSIPSLPVSSSVSAGPPPAQTYPPAGSPPPAAYTPPTVNTSPVNSPSSSIGPYPTSTVTTIITSKGPVGTGTGIVPPKNATSSYPPIASFTGAASSVSGSFGAIAGLAAIAAVFMA